MDNLIRHDEAKYKPDNSTTQRKMTQIDDFSLQEIATARDLLEREVRKTAPDGVVEAHAEVWDTCRSDVMFLPTKKKFGLLSQASKKDRLKAIKQEFELTRQHISRETKKAQKIAKKLNIFLGGYNLRVKKSSEKLGHLDDECKRNARDARCFAELLTQEDAALPTRVKIITAEVQAEAEKESAAQTKFAKLAREKETLMEQLKIVNEVI
eukprot:1386101-Amorphochlora_amoeboformis.AAC.1